MSASTTSKPAFSGWGQKPFLRCSGNEHTDLLDHADDAQQLINLGCPRDVITDQTMMNHLFVIND